jgi:hypothetical protein
MNVKRNQTVAMPSREGVRARQEQEAVEVNPKKTLDVSITKKANIPVRLKNGASTKIREQGCRHD